jgi:cell division protein FtsL
MVALDTRRRQAPPARRIRRRPRVPATRRRLLTLAFVVAVLALAFAYCAGYAKMWRMDTQYRQLQEELRRLEAEREAIENSVGILSSPLRLEEYALAHGMIRDPVVPFVAETPSPVLAVGGVASIALTKPVDPLTSP